MSERMITKVTHLPKFKKQAFSRVGIYARVSTRTAAQLHSMASQVSELTRFVSFHPDWELADIYMDFESGSGAVPRGEYARMINDGGRTYEYKIDAHQ